jgi:hypothetical protein
VQITFQLLVKVWQEKDSKIALEVDLFQLKSIKDSVLAQFSINRIVKLYNKLVKKNRITIVCRKL